MIEHIYKYKLRPEYNSNKLLLEFLDVPSSPSFVKILFNALTELNPIVNDLKDLWMNDEVIFVILIDIGEITVSVDIWELGFIMSDHQACIAAIDAILVRHEQFEKVEHIS